eukprot:3569732-Pyramimonas_sp.AAC.1
MNPRRNVDANVPGQAYGKRGLEHVRCGCGCLSSTIAWLVCSLAPLTAASHLSGRANRGGGRRARSRY